MTAVNEEITGRLPWRQLIAPDRIHLNPDNPRKEPRDLAELTKSIRQQGLKQPILIIPLPRPCPALLDDGRVCGSEDQHYVLEDGTRRFLAMREWTTGVPSVVSPSLPGQNLIMRSILTGIVVNIHREDLNPMEKAWAFGRLRDEFGLTGAQIAEQTGLSTSTVTNHLLLLELAPKAQQRVANKEIPVSEARRLLRRVRKDTRARKGQKPMAPMWEPDWLARTHPLAQTAEDRCDRMGHTRRRRIGNVACGQCWEKVLTADLSDQIELLSDRVKLLEQLLRDSGIDVPG